MIGKPERLGVAMPSSSSWPRTRPVRWLSLARSSSPRSVVDAQALQHGGQRGDRRGPGVQIRRRGGLEHLLDRGRAGDERQQRRVGLGEAADEDRRCRSSRRGGARCCCRGCRSRRARRPSARRSRRTRGRRRRRAGRRARAPARRSRARSGALPVMLLTPSMQISPGRRQLPRSSASSSSRSLWAKRSIARAARLRDRGAVVDRLVRARVQEDRAAAGEHRDHRHVDVGDRRQHEAVLGAEQFGQLVSICS